MPTNPKNIIYNGNKTNLQNYFFPIYWILITCPVLGIGKASSTQVQELSLWF